MANSSQWKSKDKDQGGIAAVADAGSTALDKAKEAAATAAKTAGDVASYVGKKADDATAAVGSGMESLGGTIREHGPQSGMLGSATSSMAKTLESTGQYLKDHGLSGIGEDLTNLIRRNPVPALLIAIGVGYLIARATRR